MENRLFHVEICLAYVLRVLLVGRLEEVEAEVTEEEVIEETKEIIPVTPINRGKRKAVIATNKVTGEKLEFDKTYLASKFFSEKFGIKYATADRLIVSQLKNREIKKVLPEFEDYTFQYAE